MFKRYSFDEMKSALEKWLSPEEDNEEVIAAPVVSTPKAPSNNNFSLDTTKAKQTKADAFDSMFDDDKKVNEVDDLPF